MPKPGFKSYIIKEELYNLLKEKFEHDKIKLQTIGVNSFSAFLTYMINKKIANEVQIKESEKIIEKIKIVSNTIILKDNIINRIIELKINNKKIFCEYDKKYDCMHVGFSYSFPEVYLMLNK
jgi:hypothetical protein